MMIMKRNKRVNQCQMRHFFGCFSKNLFGFLFVTMTITIKKCLPAIVLAKYWLETYPVYH